MKLYQLHATQFLPTDQDTAWNFLSDPKNLQNITPASMNFRIISKDVGVMFPGQIISYRVTPFPGISVKWVTEITHIETGRYFVDEQRYGPYSFWHHKHFIQAVDGGIIMEDIVDYKLPLGLLGQWMHTFLVKYKLMSVFEFRAEILRGQFGGDPDSTGNIKINSI